MVAAVRIRGGGGARTLGAVAASKGFRKGQQIAAHLLLYFYIAGDAPEMERMEIDKVLGCFEEGKLRLPFHHEEEYGSITDMWAISSASQGAEPGCQTNKEEGRGEGNARCATWQGCLRR